MILLRRATIDDCVRGNLVWWDDDPFLFMETHDDSDDPIVVIAYASDPSEEEWVRLSELGVLAK